MKKQIIAIIFLINTQCFGAAVSQSEMPGNSVQGIAITPETLYALAQQYSPTPATVQSTFNQWQKDKADNLLDDLLSFKFNDVDALRNKKGKDDAKLQAHSLQNQSPVNYIFQLPNSNYLLKIAGPINRFFNLKIEKMGLGAYNKPTTPVALQEILSGKNATYQTASRMATFLMLNEFIKKHGLKHVAVPETHLISFKSEQNAIDDNHAIIVSKQIPANAQKVDSSNLNNVSTEMIHELVKAISAGGLWSLSSNLFVEGDKLYIVDLEQPNNSTPSDFYHKNTLKYHSDTKAGVEELVKLLQNDKAKLAVAIEAIKNDSFLNSPEFQFKALIENIVKTHGK